MEMQNQTAQNQTTQTQTPVAVALRFGLVLGSIVSIFTKRNRPDFE